MKFNAFFIFLILELGISACSPINNSIVGLTPKYPETKFKVDTKTKGLELSSLANYNSVSNSGLRVSSTLGDKNSGQLKASKSGKYKVTLTIQGELATLNK